MAQEEESEHDDKARGVGDLLKEAAMALKLRRYQDAEDFCVQALGVLDKASATEHPSKAMALEYMGDSLMGLERYEVAAGFYKRAMELSERISGQDNQAYISIVYKLARTYENLSLLDECEPFFKSADELAKHHLAADHPLRETIAEGYSHLISRTKKRREKVVEIIDSFRTTKDRASVVNLREAGEEGEESEPEEEKEARANEKKDAKSSHYKLQAAAGSRDLREKSATYESSTQAMQMMVTVGVLTLVAAAVYLGYQQFSKRVALAPPVAVVDSKPAAVEFVKTYLSLDGRRKLMLSKGIEGAVGFGPNTMKAQVLQGGDTWKPGEDPAFKEPLRLNFVELQGGIMDDAGNILYSLDSPEMKMRSVMQSVAKGLRNAYLLRGSFPQNADELTQSQISYTNPVTGKSEAPIIQVFRGDQGWNLNNPEEKSTFETSFEAGNLWTNEPPFLPGAVHIFLLAGPPVDETGVRANRSSVAIIKGADKNGLPLKLDKDKAFLIVLTPSIERSTTGATPLPVPAGDSQGAVVTISGRK